VTRGSRRRPIRFAAAIACLAAAGTAAHEAALPQFDFTPPPPGSYRLERIMPAPRGTVLDVDGQPRPLARFTTGRITLLSLIYTACRDPAGCPLAYHAMVELKQRVAADPALARRVRFVTLSFDPTMDTPGVMMLYGASHLKRDSGLDWYFLTTASPRALAPIVAGFSQDLAPAENPALGAYSHVLRVFLLDRGGMVREIYSTSFLHAATMLNDIRTLALEEDGPR
jgi:cytochrome oxidase Cu insertion factor (SCO1/SenC/PrrC family)